ncbi:MAG: amino acid adenylation domain-containing protein [Ardenticatenales bacterium]|nr:amino acid adenylation domain-containing protein [Ardenticatenales bacterium]
MAPLSFAQARLWFLFEWEPDSPAYNESHGIQIKGRLVFAALEQAFLEMARRHEILRTRYAVVDDEPVQIIAPSIDWSLSQVDLSGLAEEKRDEELRKLAKIEAECPIDLRRDLPWRAVLIRLAADEHITVFTQHHISCDGWSITIRQNELTALYQAFAAGNPSPLPALPIQYGDFAYWQQQRLLGQSPDKLLAYWRQKLADATLLQLPVDRPRHPTPYAKGVMRSRALPANFTSSLQLLAQQEKVTGFIVGLATFKVLLGRYANQHDIIIGSITTNRERPELEKLIGFFVDTIILRTDLSGNPPFRELLHRVQEVVLSAQTHKDLPVDHIIAALHPRRDVMNRNPFFQVLFAWQDWQEMFPDTEGYHGTSIASLGRTATDTTKFDLTLSMEKNNGVIECSWEYNTDLYEDETIVRLAAQFETLLGAALADPDQPIGYLPLLTPDTEAQILRAWNPPPTPRPAFHSVHARFAAQAAATPDAIAIAYQDTCLSYAALEQRANQLARYLRQQGVGAETVVGICLERTPELLVALLATLKAGGAYLPLDPLYPASRREFMLRDAGAAVLLTHSQLLAQPPAFDGHTLCLDACADRLAQQETTPPRVAIHPQQNAYIIYTSGSTGLPKGVAISNGALADYTTTAIENFQVTATDRVLQFASISFDTAAEEIYPCLASGATLLLRTDDMLGPAAHFLRICRQQAITFLDLPTAYWHELTRGMVAETLLWPETVRLVIIGGERALPERWRQWRTLVSPQVQLVNTYGPTEGTIVAISDNLSQREADHEYEVPLGRPIPHVQAYILDPYLHPTPVGIPGELHIAGAGLARGYLRHPSLTAARFIPHPYSDRPGARLYKTGDLARYRPDGTIEFVGRGDNQVKIRGFRVEPGEIETVLGKHPAVAQGIILTQDIEKDPDNKLLVAYVVLKDEAKNTPISDLRQFLRQNLPDYMVPALFVSLEAFPLTVSGKVDRQALPKPEGERPDLAEAYAPPRTITEESLAAIWADVLQVQQVGVHDNFFDLGGHSLLAVQIVSRVRKVFQVELPLPQLFNTPTIADLSAFIDDALRLEQGLSLAPIVSVPRNGRLPLSFAQQRLWFLEQWDPDSAAYNMSEMTRTRGALYPEALSAAILEIVRRHEVMRTIYEVVDGEPFQVVEPVPAWSLPLIDLADLSERAREAEMMRLASAQAQRPFHLQREQPWRAVLIRLAADEHVTVFTQHHISCDGWSIQLRKNELTSLYEALAIGDPSSLPALPIQYADFAHWQRERLQGEALERLQDYWRQKLANFTPLQLPTDRPHPPVQTDNGATRTVRLSPSLNAGLDALCRQESVTGFMISMAVLKILLSRMTGQTDITVGSSFANRDRPELEKLIGFFVDTIVLRTDLSGNPTFRALLQRTRQVVLEAHLHKDLPVEHIIASLQTRRDMSRNVLVQFLFEWQDWRHMAATEGTADTTAEDDVVGVSTNAAKFDLALFAEAQNAGIICSWEYNTDLYEDETIVRLAAQFETLLGAALADPDQPIGYLPLLTPDTEAQILRAWNPPPTPRPAFHSVHARFAAQAAATPDAIAIAYQDTCLSYAALEQRANQLARYLRQQGVGAETVVGICLERTPELLVALLATLKAGGAYLPLDPLYPASRREFMLRDAGAAVLLTHSQLLAQPPAFDGHTLCLDACADRLAQQETTPPRVAIHPQQNAYIIYTSGSTGLPKGVAISNGALADYTTTAIENFQVTATDRVLQFASISFDTAAEEIYPCLASGATLLLRTDDMLGPAAHFLRICRQQAITFLDLPTAYWHELTRGMVAETLLWPETVRLVIIGGERALPERWRQWRTLVSPQVQLVNTYGPTEGTIVAISDNLSQREADHEYEVPLGRPIPHVQAYILDPYLHPTPVGIPGELHIAGAGLARGYLRHPSLTAARFIPHPYSDRPGARLYKTGDLARYRPDGTIEFVGRGDNQVKIRGFRIEPGEIEARLTEHPQVGQAAVIAREDTPGNSYLTAYVVGIEDHALNVNEIRAFLQEKLPDYMIPTSIVMLEAMPLTTSGKLDRRMLPTPERVRPELDGGYVAPRTLSEEMLTELWAETLGIEQPGIYDNFFELGGHSMLVIQLMAKVQDVFQVELSLRLFFEQPTIAELALALDEILLTEIEGLSEEEVMALLEDEEALSTGGKYAEGT